MPLDLNGLNENQRKAVLWNKGPLLVLAGPGSGKTSVLTYRVARLLEEDGDASVLALTFTNKAAAEMRDRVDQLLNRRDYRAHLCTFHAFATELLRQHGSHTGLRSDFRLIVQAEDRLALLESPKTPKSPGGAAVRLREAGHAVPADPKQLLDLLDHLFRESYDGGAAIPGLPNPPKWVPALFSGYCEALIASNTLDFGSLLSLARRLLRDSAGVRRVLQISWSHVCVDEFQDTNRAQYELLKLLVPAETPNLFVVADDDQIIYQWNGASPERLETLRRDFGITEVQLPENYRCPADIVELANSLIRQNQMRTQDKRPMAASRPPSGNDAIIRYEAFPTFEDEAAAVARDILSRGTEAPDCVVLARTGKLLEGVAAALQAEGLPPYLPRRKGDLTAPLVAVALNALRLANARHDREILRRLCVAWNALTDASIEVEDVGAAATLLGGDFLRAWVEQAQRSTNGVYGDIVSQVRDRLVDHLDFVPVVEALLGDGWLLWKDPQDLELQEEIDIWAHLHAQFLNENERERITLNAYLQSMDLASKVQPPPMGAVRCLTVHGSKGLEFNHVYLIGMAQEILPSFQALQHGPHSRELEEERRNCFVAITRARESLMLTRAEEYNGWPKDPSQFLFEMSSDQD